MKLVHILFLFCASLACISATRLAPADNIILNITDHLQSWDFLGGDFIPQSKDNGILYNAFDTTLKFLDHKKNGYYNLRGIHNIPGASVSAILLTEYKIITEARLNSRVSQYDITTPATSNRGTTPINPDHPCFKVGELEAVLANIDSYVSAQLSALTDSPQSITKGINLGTQIANKIVDFEAGDGASVLGEIVAPPCGVPGQWCPQISLVLPPPSFRTAVYPQFGGVRMFNMDADQFIVPPPFDINSNTFRADLNITRIYGGAVSQFRSPADDMQMRWWANAGAQVTALRFMRALAFHENLLLTLGETATLFAKATSSILNAVINNGINKNKHEAWRPFQAIRYYNENPGDDTWLPSFSTPFNQEYPCGHCEVTASFTGILRSELGFDTFPSGPLTMSNYYGTPNDILTFRSLSEVENSVVQARVFGGMHLMNSGIVGTKLGIQIAEWTSKNLFSKDN